MLRYGRPTATRGGVTANHSMPSSLPPLRPVILSPCSTSCVPAAGWWFPSDRRTPIRCLPHSPGPRREGLKLARYSPWHSCRSPASTPRRPVRGFSQSNRADQRGLGPQRSSSSPKRLVEPEIQRISHGHHAIPTVEFQPAHNIRLSGFQAGGVMRLPPALYI